jgi:predicted CxxxxCH...CXXCH cytochrome family protein
MGAAFNYVLLLKEPGAYAHNSAYEKQLIFDSIDYLYNGTITGSIDSAVSSLVDNGITQAQADSLIAYKSTNSCISCHANTSGSHPAHLNSGFGCADCHNETAATNTTLVPGTTTHLNGVADLQAGLGRSFSYSGGTCSNISCHYNGTATWGGTLGCNGCHGNPPATFSHMKHAGKGVNYSFACSECHKGNTHANGTFQDVFIDKSGIIAGSAATYTAAIRTCSALYCHSNGTSLATGQPSGGSVVWGSNTLGCSGCHDNPPAYATGSPKANSHVSHSFGCGFCHAGTTTDGLTISDNTLHSNGVYNVTPGAGVSFTYVFSATGGTCSNISCHNNGTAVWGATLTCVSCHVESPGGD